MRYLQHKNSSHSSYEESPPSWNTDAVFITYEMKKNKDNIYQKKKWHSLCQKSTWKQKTHFYYK